LDIGIFKIIEDDWLIHAFLQELTPTVMVP
jgi:hypothetical protein